MLIKANLFNSAGEAHIHSIYACVIAVSPLCSFLLVFQA